MTRNKTHNANFGPTAVAQDIYEESSTQRHPLGTRLVLGERIFHYALNGEVALASGRLLQSEVPVSNFTSMVLATSIVADTSREVVVDLGGTLATLNQFTDGWLWSEDGTNIGQCHKIKGNTAQSSTSGECTFYLYDKIAEALTASTDGISVVMSPYKYTLVKPASAPTAQILGVSLIDVTASVKSSKTFYYFWVQTAGPAPILYEADTKPLVIGEDAVADDADAGACSGVAANTNTDVIIGTVIDIGADGGMALINLDIKY